jgi:hypothetical protein
MSFLCYVHAQCADAPVLIVHTILSHKYVDTTVCFARPYDATMVADCHRMVDEAGRCLTLQQGTERPAPSIRQLLALLDPL